MSDVFISYSRKNSDFARRLIDRLTRKGKDAWVDWEGIPLTSPNWWNEIKAGVESADSFVFILSPDSMASVVCNMELDYAVELGKRIVPIVFEEVATRDAFASIADFEPDDAMTERLQGKDPLMIARDNWQRLSHINWVFFREGDDFDAAFESLVQTVETDLEYVKAHTRYLTRATEWQREQQRADLLLFGEEIDRAEVWLQKAETYTRTLAAQAKQEVVNPLAQDVQREYIRISREADKRRKRLARSAQLSIAVLAVVLIGGLVIGSAIVSNTQQEASNIQATSDQSVAVANTQVAGAEVEAEAARNEANAAATDVADANEALTAVPPTLTQVNEQVVIAEDRAQAANTQVAVANATLTPIPPTLTQAAELREEAERSFDISNAQSNALLTIDNRSRALVQASGSEPSVR